MRLVWCGAVVFVFALGSLAPDDTWSPYYRVTVQPADDAGRIGVVVNSLPHQSMMPLAQIQEEFYTRPYTHLRQTPQDVLIVGAGNGNDVALALSRDVGHIDAVEIDPVIQAAGRDRHPAHPVSGPTREPAHRRRPRVPGTDRSDL